MTDAGDAESGSRHGGSRLAAHVELVDHVTPGPDETNLPVIRRAARRIRLASAGFVLLGVGAGLMRSLDRTSLRRVGWFELTQTVLLVLVGCIVALLVVGVLGVVVVDRLRRRATPRAPARRPEDLWVSPELLAYRGPWGGSRGWEGSATLAPPALPADGSPTEASVPAALRLTPGGLEIEAAAGGATARCPWASLVRVDVHDDRVSVPTRVGLTTVELRYAVLEGPGLAGLQVALAELGATSEQRLDAEIRIV